MPKTKRFKDISYRDALKKELERAPKPKLSEVAANFIKLAGGPTQFAKHLWDEYNAATPGSLNRQRIMALIMMCLKQDEEVFDPASLDEMDDQDLKNLFRTLNETVGSLDGRPEEDPADQAPAGQEGPAAASPPETTKAESPGEADGVREEPAAAEGEDEDWPAPPS